jgi:hypothetical protein
MENTQKRAITLDEVIAQTQPLVDITDFNGTGTVTFKLKRMSLFTMVKTGKIPNTLLNSAGSLFGINESDRQKDPLKTANPEDVNRLMDVIETVCEASLVQPSYAEIKEYLTDNQKMEIFYFSQGGITALSQFRQEQGNT